MAAFADAPLTVRKVVVVDQHSCTAVVKVDSCQGVVIGHYKVVVYVSEGRDHRCFAVGRVLKRWEEPVSQLLEGRNVGS